MPFKISTSSKDPLSLSVIVGHVPARSSTLSPAGQADGEAFGRTCWAKDMASPNKAALTIHYIVSSSMKELLYCHRQYFPVSSTVPKSLASLNAGYVALIHTFCISSLQISVIQSWNLFS